MSVYHMCVVPEIAREGIGASGMVVRADALFWCV